MTDLAPVRRALISVSDKSGLTFLAEGLHGLGVTLISTGGTAAVMSEAGLSVTPVERITGFAEMLAGRVKTPRFLPRRASPNRHRASYRRSHSGSRRAAKSSAAQAMRFRCTLRVTEIFARSYAPAVAWRNSVS